MTLSYRDILGDDERKTIEATITTDHSSSHYGGPVIVLPDGGGLDYQSAALLDYQIEEASAEEADLLNEWRRRMPPLM
ncbi:hypothetical protein [Marispirochaeta sp.]|uniref:hypothetical protein n=1 Tax=Marispirochaeta sp. TaxID=2038653 RepID=UPI0029C830AA|nr:hypothetical protein [Marispirochaeta sp.]